MAHFKKAFLCPEHLRMVLTSSLLMVVSLNPADARPSKAQI